jgi:hypothetical protein
MTASFATITLEKRMGFMVVAINRPEVYNAINSKVNISHVFLLRYKMM